MDEHSTAGSGEEFDVLLMDVCADRQRVGDFLEHIKSTVL
jgi:hypothetical protein